MYLRNAPTIFFFFHLPAYSNKVRALFFSDGVLEGMKVMYWLGLLEPHDFPESLRLLMHNSHP